LELFLQIGLLIIFAAALAIFFDLLKIPSLISYIVAGVAASYFGLKPASESVDIMIEIGIILLLFLAGLEIKLKELVKLGKKTLLIGEGHDLAMAIIGFILAYFLMRFDTLASFYIAIGVTLSSTIVIIKTLTNRKELAAPHGKILIGTMVLQDLVAMIALAIFSSIGTKSSLLASIGTMFYKGILIFLILFLIGKYILPKIFYYSAKSVDLVFLVALGWCFSGVGLAGFSGFSTSIGAFLAGLAIADLPFSFEIADKAKGLRDFGILLFFLSVGLQLHITKTIFTNWHFYLLIAYVILFTPLITSIIARILRFTKKEIFIMSVLPTQISEFTLILITFGLAAGHLSKEIYTMLTLVVVITIMLSCWLNDNINNIYRRIEDKISFIESRYVKQPRHLKKDLKNHVVIFGFGLLGQYVADFYKKKKKDVVVVEWRPKLIDKIKKKGYILVYGDAGDSDIWEEIKMNKANVIISTIGENQEDDLNMMQWSKKKNPKALKITETNHPKNAKELYKAGADVVLIHDNLEWNDLKKYLKAGPKKRKKLKKVFEV